MGSADFGVDGSGLPIPFPFLFWGLFLCLFISPVMVPGSDLGLFPVQMLFADLDNFREHGEKMTAGMMTINRSLFQEVFLEN